jgi:metal-sulfur cluster biosynthetic enzyme
MSQPSSPASGIISISVAEISTWTAEERNHFVDLLEAVKESLAQVIDPETGMDVIRMKLVRDLKVDENGNVELTFRPSSVLCPLGFQLGISIKQAVLAVHGVRSVLVNVDGFVHADQLQTILKELD